MGNCGLHATVSRPRGTATAAPIAVSGAELKVSSVAVTSDCRTQTDTMQKDRA
jgi:hypothetical protein